MTLEFASHVCLSSSVNETESSDFYPRVGNSVGRVHTWTTDNPRSDPEPRSTHTQ